MDFKKLFIGGIVGAVVFFLLGYLIYGMLLMDFMTNNPGTAGNVGKPEAELDFMYLAMGNLAQGFLLAYIFVKANVKTLTAGLITGAVIGFLITVGYDCIMYGTTNLLSKKAMAADVVAATVMTAVAGAIIGMVLGMGKKTA